MRGWFLCGMGMSAAIATFVACSSDDAQGTSVVGADAGADARGADSGHIVPPDPDPVVDASDDGAPAHPCTGKVVINELEPGVGDAGAEFIELFNPTDCAISLGDWRLLYRSASGAAGVGSLHTFALGDDIRARTFLLLGNAKFEGQIDAELTGAMGNAGGQVGLLDDQGTVIDAVGYGVLTDAGVYTEKTPVALKADTVSIGRKKDGVDTDDNSADFKSFKAHTAGVSNQ